jgi:hypothetical protein
MNLTEIVPLIGLVGYARTGKDTAADYLATLGYKKVGFADRLKAYILAIDPIVDGDRDKFDTFEPVRLSQLVTEIGMESAKNMYPEVRGLLERAGNQGRELFGHDFWVNQLLDHERPGWGNSIVIKDVRYPNEAAVIQEKWDGAVVRIHRPGIEPIHFTDFKADEIEARYEVVNDGTPEELGPKIEALLREDYL